MKLKLKFLTHFLFYFGILWFTLSSKVSLFVYICDDDQTSHNMRSPSIPLLFFFSVILLLEWLSIRLRCSSTLFARAFSSGWSLLVPLLSIVSRHFVRPNLSKKRSFFYRSLLPLGEVVSGVVLLFALVQFDHVFRPDLNPLTLR